MSDLVSSVDLGLEILKIGWPYAHNTILGCCHVELIIRSSNKLLDCILMNLNDFVHLASMVIDEVEEAISRCHKYMAWFLGGISCLLGLSLSLSNNGFVKDLASSSVVENNWLSRKMTILNLEQLDVLLPACDHWIWDSRVESHEVSLKICELPCHDLNLFKFNHLCKFVNNDDVSYLVIFASQAEVFHLRSTRYAHRVDGLHGRLEGEYTLALSICGIQIVKRPYCHLIVFGLLLQASANCEREVLVVWALLYK